MAEADPAAPPSGQAGLVARLTAPGAALGPFGYPAFRAIWLAFMFSQIGSQIQAVAAAWLMTDLSTSHAMVAGVQASANLPILFFAVLAGALADNFDRRMVMLVSQCAMLVVAATLSVLTWLEWIGPWSLLAFTLAVGSGTALNGPAWQASVRAQVGQRDLSAAVSLNTIANNLGRSLGPALGGLLVALTSVAVAFAVNSLSFFALIWALLRWRPNLPKPVRRPILPSIAEGLSFCIHSSPVRRILLRCFCVGAGGTGFHALLPSIVRSTANGNEFDYGLILAAFGVGSVGGALVVTTIRRRFGAEALVTLGSLAMGLSMVAIGMETRIWTMIPFAVLVGAGWIAAMTTFNVGMQVRSPEYLLGRCMSVYQAVVFGGISLGAWGWGLISDALSLSFAMIAAGCWLVLGAAAGRFVAPMPVRGEGRVPDPV